MKEFSLGPNGALLYCIDFLDTNSDWLLKQIDSFEATYFIFDLPGQIELYLMNNSMRNVISKIRKNKVNPIELTCVELFDYHFVYDT